MKKHLAILLLAAVALSCGQQRTAGPDGDVSFIPERTRGGKDAPAPTASPRAAAVDVRVKMRTGTMSLVVSEIKAAEEALADLTARYAGYTALSRIVVNAGTLTLKIPEDSFDGFIAEAEKLGRLTHKEITTEDVSDKYFDLENRIRNLRIMLARYQEYLKRAANTAELLEIERSINTVTTEIESLEGSFRNLKNLVYYSTLTVSLELPPEMRRAVEIPTLAAGLRAAGEFLLAFLYYLFFIVLYTLIVAVPLTLFGGFVYFVGFGRIGLIVKFFKALAPKKKP